jgi:peptidylprolyl isomerase
MTFKDGDFLEIDYSMWDAMDNSLVATTEEQKAKNGGIYNKDTRYGPTLVVLGANNVISGLDKALHSMSVNEQKKFTFKPEEAFGERNEEFVRVMPIAGFRKNDIDPYVGMQVNIDNMPVIVKSINSGRVVVDANHPYAGRDVIYEVKIVKALMSDREKVEALGKSYGAAPTKIEEKEGALVLSFNDSVSKDANYFMGKANLVASIFANLKTDRVRIEEEYERPKEKNDKEKA